MPRSFRLAPLEVNNNTALKLNLNQDHVPTDETYFLTAFHVDKMQFGAVIYESEKSKKIFVLNLAIPSELSNHLVAYQNNEISASELNILFQKFNESI